MLRLNESTIKLIEDYLNDRKSIEVHVEKEQIVVVELSRRVTFKQPANK